MAALDAVEEHKICTKYRSLLNLVIGFETQKMAEVLETEIRYAKALVRELERIDQLLRSASDIPQRNYVSRTLRWIARNGSETQKAEASAILALETNHRHQEI